MKVLKTLRKLLISVFVVVAFLICVDRLKNFEKFKNFLESKKVERSMKKEQIGRASCRERVLRLL